MTIENNSEAWRELRSRVDSIANAVFLVATGALSLSITVALGEKRPVSFSEVAIALTTQAWYALLAAIILFLLLKTHLVFQAFARQFWPEFVDKYLATLNVIGWVFGICGMLAFIGGLVQMIRAATIAIAY
jgi:hypothetical protein